MKQLADLSFPCVCLSRSSQTRGQYYCKMFIAFKAFPSFKQRHDTLLLIPYIYFRINAKVLILLHLYFVLNTATKRSVSYC